MIEIKKHGNANNISKYEVACPRCGCILTCNEFEDVIIEEN